MQPIRWSIALLAVLLSVHTSIAADRVHVLVELFTSEGCESCPPADEVLIRLAQQRSFGNADVVVMSEHVDYWDYLGWRDPFSSRQFTDRQNEYASASGGRDVYTPQIIVDGSYNVLGSNYAGVAEAITQASRKSKAPLEIGTTPRGNSIQVHVDANPVGEQTTVYLAVTEDNLVNNVSRGENKGRKLTHFGVVRQLSILGSGKSNVRFTADKIIKLAPDWKPQALHAVVFIQSARSHSILALSETSLGQ